MGSIQYLSAQLSAFEIRDLMQFNVIICLPIKF